MADVFISYSPLDHARVRAIAERLSSLGYAVVWAPTARRNQARNDEIARQLDAAAAVLTVWSHHARNSTLVFAQAAYALDAQKLLQLRLDETPAPAPFSTLPIADMSGERAEWGPLEHELQRLAQAGAPPEPQTRPRMLGLFATPAPAGAPKLLTAAALLTLLGYAGAVSAALSGAMTPEQLQFAMTGVAGIGGVCAAFAAYRWLIVHRSGG